MEKILTIIFFLLTIFSYSQDKKQITIYSKNPYVYESINNEYKYLGIFFFNINLYLDFDNNIFSLITDRNITYGDIVLTELYDLKHKLIPPNKLEKKIKKEKVFRYMIYTDNSKNDHEYLFMINYKLDKYQILETYENKTYLFYMDIDEIKY